MKGLENWLLIEENPIEPKDLFEGLAATGIPWYPPGAITD
jgi:hypothetical protein